ncbi:MAG: hypothetical protein A2268_03390 [Candidatus Raymondbacteria bacterium RifOxyA12_full_50_37]|nr:MAG: hypothetical protein A2268_03390 [Candidatus Raymondbacteria bacterium RifOxyA12_full_50_37]OGJ87482.1 MAG: hypothetical protein A2248_22130 [Candidatus Raymondbacteria bacterium RIFOXYA2_FULL_49_16]OGJ94890.1 MAG: hypothetical protein A2487_11430 [Candidatus Raymondbacteria bacterium RifOxyC12_full_50_8]OGJ96422.1 MAG: hypothetical protein A2453_01745 [Candidatus Raymondbacteria bacterium RIFOXYC2_FULL_50_21]OGJ99563.1 MAG: hypothetical protein A2350_10075 [Candidatus Raymondbacteria b
MGAIVNNKKMAQLRELLTLISIMFSFNILIMCTRGVNPKPVSSEDINYKLIANGVWMASEYNSTSHDSEKVGLPNIMISPYYIFACPADDDSIKVAWSNRIACDIYRTYLDGDGNIYFNTINDKVTNDSLDGDTISVHVKFYADSTAISYFVYKDSSYIYHMSKTNKDASIFCF